MKKKTCWALFLCLFLVSKGLFAQKKLFKVGLDVGYTYNVMHANLSNLIDSKYTGRYGIGVNLSGEYMIWKTLFVSTGISLLQKNYEFSRTGTRSGWYTKYNSNFLSVPFMIGTYVLNNPYESSGVWLKLSGGVYTDYWLSLKREGNYPVFGEIPPDFGYYDIYRKVSDTYDFKKNENQLSRLGYGLQGQIQLGYSFKKIDVFGSYTHQYGLSNIYKTENKEQKMSSRSYMISIGVNYLFN
ncbi:outer membrane beta-barrel protein [Flavobacterium poyangense]|uniref:outer membrane beta-barrel protein n=1 Tax=Flavobacterium poyangense TaxID=2204302 RepID=UPI001421AFCF|nr:outer membrane beta-barrel protein [Flavobacterium sp. JXAS1]